MDVRVNPNVTGTIRNTATVTADDLPPRRSTAVTRVVGPRPGGPCRGRDRLMGSHARRRPLTLWLAGGAVACAVAVGGGIAGAAGSGGGTQTATADGPATRAIASRPTTREAWTARVLLPVHTRSAPRAGARKTSKLGPTAPYNNGPNVLLVIAARATADARRLVPGAAQQPSQRRRRLGAGRGRARRAHAVARDRPPRAPGSSSSARRGRWSAPGRSPSARRANPTPTGSFALSEIVKQRDPAGFFGTYILTLTAHSVNLSEFDGGDGRVALHGTNQPQLLGQAVSHGCVRLANTVATRIARTVPAGAPVDILR